jgi:two-component system CheB/CheR fusion protein
VEAEPERVRAFRDASLKGWDDAVALPAEAIDLILAKYASGESRDRLEFQAREVRRLVDAELVAIGHMNPHRWAKAIPEPVEPESQARGVGLPEDLLFDGADAEPSRRWMRVLLRAVACLTAILPALLFGVVALRVAVRRRTAELARTNRRLELEMRERHAVEELVRVQRDAAVVLGGMSTLETSLEPLLDILLRLPDADSVGLYLVQEASGAVDLAAHRGVGEAFARHFSRGSAGSHVERVVSAGKTICVDSDEISRAADVETLREGVKSFALVPMLHEGRVVAVIALGSHHAKAVSPGSVLAMESVAQNFGSILSRLRAAAAVLESERNFRQVSECAYDGVAIVDPTGETLYVNSNLVKMLGATLADVGSKRFIDFIPAPSRVEVAQRLRDRAAGRPVSEHFETALRRLDGAEIPVDVTARRTEWKGRPALSYSFRDMSEKKRLEREVLSVAEWEKRRIAHDLHDGLGQRLTGIGYLLDALIASLEGVSPVQAAAATKIRANCTTAHQELRHIVRGVLPVRDDETLQDCLARSAGDAAEQFGIACVFSDQLGGAAPTHAAKANLYHIVQEAVTNAVRHGGARRVEITLRPEAGGWALTVEDDGRGFDTDASSTNGSGMRIMHYRADLAGGTLTFGRAALGGVCVRCAFAPGGVADRPTRTGGGR